MERIQPNIKFIKETKKNSKSETPNSIAGIELQIASLNHTSRMCSHHTEEGKSLGILEVRGTSPNSNGFKIIFKPHFPY